MPPSRGQLVLVTHPHPSGQRGNLCHWTPVNIHEFEHLFGMLIFELMQPHAAHQYLLETNAKVPICCAVLLLLCLHLMCLFLLVLLGMCCNSFVHDHFCQLRGCHAARKLLGSGSLSKLLQATIVLLDLDSENRECDCLVAMLECKLARWKRSCHLFIIYLYYEEVASNYF